MTHNERVLQLLSDGEPHSHHELYDLRVVAHSRVSSLRKQGHVIEHWVEAGLHWYRLLGGLSDGCGTGVPQSPEGHPASPAAVAEPVPVVEHPDGTFALDLGVAA